MQHSPLYFHGGLEGVPQPTPQDMLHAMGATEEYGPITQTAVPNLRLGPPVITATLPRGQELVHRIFSGNKSIGHIRVFTYGKEATIDWLGAPISAYGKSLDELANKIGPAGLRDLARQFSKFHPSVETIAGLRVGGRAGKEARLTGQAGKVVEKNLKDVIRGQAGTNRQSLIQAIAKARKARGTTLDPEQQFGLNMYQRVMK